MRARLLRSYLTISLFVLIVLEVPFAVLVAQRERDRLSIEVERDAVVLATFYEDALEHGDPFSTRPAFDYAAESGTRVVIVDENGISILDTDDQPNRDFSNRFEIGEALAGRRAVGQRPSETLGRDLGFVAVPVASGGRVHGAVRVTFDPARVDARVHRFWWSLVGVGLVVLVSLTLVGFVIARSITGPLERLREAAHRAASGDLEVEVDAHDAPFEVRELAESLNHMVGRVRDMLNRERLFVSDASHQLRTPLTALRLRLENAVAGDGDAGPDLMAALEEVDRLASLVEQLLRLARSEGAEHKPVRTDLAETVRERVELWAGLAGEMSVELVVIDVAKSAPVMSIPGALEQIIDNLLENALGVSVPGGEVTIVVDPHGVDHWVLAVMDRGPGLPAADLETAFERFWRGSTERPGTGLGLAIVRELVEASGGTAELVEREGGGLTARVVLGAAQGRRPVTASRNA